MSSRSRIYQLLAMGVITASEARDLLVLPDLTPEGWEPEVIERAQRLRDERDSVIG